MQKRNHRLTCLLCAAMFLGNAASAYSQAKTTKPAADPHAFLDMTFPEFEAATAATDVLLLPIGSIEEHGLKLPLSTDTLLAVAQLRDVQSRLQQSGIRSLVGPPLNIGITNEAGDWTRDGTYMYPGSLTISTDAFVSLYVDLLRSLHDNGFRHAFLVSGHLGGRHLKAVARIAEESNKRLPELIARALIDSERLDQLQLTPTASVEPIKLGLNFQMLTQLLGKGPEPAVSVHADGWEVSLMLHYYPNMVRAGYRQLPQSPSLRFFDSITSGDRSKNPTGAGGFPFAKASAAAGKAIADYRTLRIADAIKLSLSATPATRQ